MNRIKKIIQLSFLLISLITYGQNNWSLDACVEYALQHNLTLTDLNYTQESNQESYRQAYRDLLPSIDANSNYVIRYGRSVDPNNNSIVSTDFFSNNYSVNASLILFQGFQRQNRIAATRFLNQAAKEDVNQEKYLLAFRVMSAYYDVRFFQGLVTISKEQVDISLSNFKLVEKQIELGLKAGSDKYEAESVLISDRLLVTQNENGLKAAKLKLIQEMNLENTSDIDIASLETENLDNEIQEIATDSVFDKAVAFMPSIKAQELRVDAAKKDIGFARGSLYPTISLFAGYGTGYFETNVNEAGNIIPFRTQIKDNASQFVGVSLNVPILDRWSSRSQIKQQKIALSQADNRLDIQKQELLKLTQELVQSYDATRVELEQTEQSEASRELAFTIAQKKYDKGLISTIDLFQSKNLYTNAQNENLQAQLKLKVQRKTLDFFMGLPVFNITTN